MKTQVIKQKSSVQTTQKQLPSPPGSTSTNHLAFGKCYFYQLSHTQISFTCVRKDVN